MDIRLIDISTTASQGRLSGYWSQLQTDEPFPSSCSKKGYFMASTKFYLLFCALLLLPSGAIAQITPDNSLGAESSRTVPATINNLPSDRIDGGATRGSSLFHSFGEFNIGQGRGAYFANPSGVTNIFTRVTGGNQ